MRPEALIFGGRMMRGWSVMDRLGEIRVPTLVAAGHDDFLFPPESQALLAAGIPNARLRIIERAGHNPQSERPAETLAAVADFLAVAPVREHAGGGRPASGACGCTRSSLTVGATAIDRQGAASVCDVYVHESGAPGAPGCVHPRRRTERSDVARPHGSVGRRVLLPGAGPPGSGAAIDWRPSRSNRRPTSSRNSSLPAYRRVAHVVGLSYGGSVVFALLDRHPGSSTA